MLTPIEQEQSIREYAKKVADASPVRVILCDIDNLIIDKVYVRVGWAFRWSEKQLQQFPDAVVRIRTEDVTVWRFGADDSWCAY